jgi:hypothetical protein
VLVPVGKGGFGADVGIGRDVNVDRNVNVGNGTDVNDGIDSRDESVPAGAVDEELITTDVLVSLVMLCSTIVPGMLEILEVLLEVEELVGFEAKGSANTAAVGVEKGADSWGCAAATAALRTRAMVEVRIVCAGAGGAEARSEAVIYRRVERAERAPLRNARLRWWR